MKMIIDLWEFFKDKEYHKDSDLVFMDFCDIEEVAGFLSAEVMENPPILHLQKDYVCFELREFLECVELDDDLDVDRFIERMNR